jgi:hypothetical protein
MSFDITILSKRIQGIKEAFENGQFADALVGALNTGNGLMQQRIFSQNKDVEGQDFGTYIGKKFKVGKLQTTKNRTQAKRNKAVEGQELTYYQKKRALRGRQTVKKDLELEGSLRRSIETQVEDERSAVINFSNTESALIAHGQEQQITNIRNGKPGTTKGAGATKIFTLDTKEREEVTEQGALLIKEILKPK